MSDTDIISSLDVDHGLSNILNLTISTLMIKVEIVRFSISLMLK